MIKVITLQIQLRYKIFILIFTIKILIILVVKSLLLEVVLLIGDSNFKGILVFRS